MLGGTPNCLSKSSALMLKFWQQYDLIEKILSVHLLAEDFATSIALVFLLKSSGSRRLCWDTLFFSSVFIIVSLSISFCILSRSPVFGFFASSDAIFLSSAFISAFSSSLLDSTSSSCFYINIQKEVSLQQVVEMLLQEMDRAEDSFFMGKREGTILAHETLQKLLYQV